MRGWLTIGSVIFIHGVATLGSTSGTQQFANVLRALVPANSNILSCDLKVRLQETFGWRDLSSRGRDLLKLVYEHHEQAKV